MSIFDNVKAAFTGEPAPQQQQVAPKPGDAPPPLVPAVPDNQGNIPAAPTVVAEPGNVTAPITPAPAPQDDSPLAQFAKLWEPVPVDKDAPKPPASPTQMNVEDLQKVVAKVDFSQHITPENLTAITEGGEGAAAAFTEALNAVARQVLVQSTLVNNKVTEQAVAAATKAAEDNIPALLRSQSTSASLKDSNPLFTNPAIKPVIEATQTQLLAKFPNATPAEINKMTEEFVLGMGEHFAPKVTPASDGSSSTDFSNFLETGG